MSSDSYVSYRRSADTVKKSLFSTDPSEREEADDMLRRDREKAKKRETEPPKLDMRDRSHLYDASQVKNKIIRPAPGVKRVHIRLTDNSGSNRIIAEHTRKSTEYFNAMLELIDPQAQVADMYFSDHGDENLLMQEIDFFSPGEKGLVQFYSSTHHIRAANGYDQAEAYECALMRICQIDFGDAVKKHLYLVGDQVAHGMGLRSDDGCPNQVDWRKAVDLVYKTFTTFNVIGCGDDPQVGELQKKFLRPERVPFDFIDMSGIQQLDYRLGITPNAFLFLAARTTGLQGIELFLTALYHKWRIEPLFGPNTELKAKDAIRRFGKYIEADPETVEKLMTKILAD